MKYLIVGLGNVGEEYEGTRHNIGFEILDSFSKKYKSDFIVDKHAEISTLNLKVKKVNLIKPSNYVKGTAMNFAGLGKISDRANLIAYLEDSTK